MNFFWPKTDPNQTVTLINGKEICRILGTNNKKIAIQKYGIDRNGGGWHHTQIFIKKMNDKPWGMITTGKLGYLIRSKGMVQSKTERDT